MKILMILTVSLCFCSCSCEHKTAARGTLACNSINTQLNNFWPPDLVPHTPHFPSPEPEPKLA